MTRSPTRRAVATGALATTLLLPTIAAGRTVRPTVLMIATSVGAMPDGRPTGLWLSELMTPYWTFLDAGLDVTMASIAGGAPPVDPRSLEGPRGRGPSVDRFEASAEARRRYDAMPPLDEVADRGFDVVFLRGGHGTMWDFRGSDTLRGLVEAQDRRGAVVAALCHGPAGLLDARRADGTHILAGRAATGFTNAEEDTVDLTAAMPYLLETEMRGQDARFTSADPFEPHAVRAGNLVTGQNPASAAMTADAVLAALTHGHSASR